MTQWGVDTLFNPAKRHMDEEKRRLQATRAEVGDNSGGRRIDLESGKVRISRGAKGETDEADEPSAADEADQPAADIHEVAAPADARTDAASAEAVEAASAEAAAPEADTDAENGS